MTAEEHNKTLATLHFIYGAMHGLTLLGLIILLLVVFLATPAASTISAFWILEGSVVVVTLFVVVGLLPLIVGYGFRRRSRWVKPAGIVLAVLSLINIPIGTALGIYTIRFLRSPGGVKLYGGSASSRTEGELKDAMDGAQPLLNLADKWK